MSGLTLSLGGGVSRFCSTCLESIRRTFHFHIPLYACAALFVAATFGVVSLFHVPLDLSTSITFIDNIAAFLMIVLPFSAMIRLYALYREGCRTPLAGLTQSFAGSILAGERPGNVFHSVLAFTPLMISFAGLKEQIPNIEPFSWDKTFMQWDRVLGFGQLPWERIQPLVGHPVILAALNFNYDLWFILMFGCLFWQAFAARGGLLRMQFLLAFAFAWFIGGNVLAVFFSSAGPCFYGHLFHHDPYAAQMAYLRATNQNWPIWSLQVQDMLWQAHVKGGGAVSGISAMPSMHVMSSVLMTLLAWRTNKWLGIWFTAFTSLIVIGSVALAWHYFVDSIAAVALALAFWAMAGAVAKAALHYSSARQAA
jgi:hypothetical protein